jgi:hypothetical protein
MHYEKSVNFNRKEIKIIYDEYPFAHKLPHLLTDLEVRNKLKKLKPGYEAEFGEDLKQKKNEKSVIRRKILEDNNK